MADPYVELASALPAATALKVASSLEIDGRLSKALEKVAADSPAATALTAVHAAVGSGVLASVLRGFARAAENNATDIRAVWSGPTFEGDGDHTTSALAHLVDGATEDVFASTYSATADSEFVAALWRAVARGVQTTLLVDSSVNKGNTLAMLRERLAGARFLTYTPPAGHYGVQHSKVVIIDSRKAFVTSANLSRAATERNIEAGIVVDDPAFASRMRQRFANLRASGALIEIA